MDNDAVIHPVMSSGSLAGVVLMPINRTETVAPSSPINMKGRRRPQRVTVTSLRWPNSGMLKPDTNALMRSEYAETIWRLFVPTQN